MKNLKVLLALVVFVLATSSPLFAEQGVQLSSLEQEMVDRANRIREQHGLAPLEVSPQLQNAARAVVANRAFSHASAGQYARQQGYSSFSTENLGSGHHSAQEAIDDWNKEQGSVGHHQQMRGNVKMDGRWVNGGFTHIAASGQPGGVWVIYFGSSSGAPMGVVAPSAATRQQQAVPQPSAGRRRFWRR